MRAEAARVTRGDFVKGARNHFRCFIWTKIVQMADLEAAMNSRRFSAWGAQRVFPDAAALGVKCSVHNVP